MKVQRSPCSSISTAGIGVSSSCPRELLKGPGMALGKSESGPISREGPGLPRPDLPPALGLRFSLLSQKEVAPPDFRASWVPDTPVLVCFHFMSNYLREAVVTVPLSPRAATTETCLELASGSALTPGRPVTLCQGRADNEYLEPDPSLCLHSLAPRVPRGWLLVTCSRKPGGHCGTKTEIASCSGLMINCIFICDI